MEKHAIIEKIKEYLEIPHFPFPKTTFHVEIFEINFSHSKVRVAPAEITIFDSVEGVQNIRITNDEYKELIELYLK